MLDKLTNLTVIPVGYGEHCNFTLRIDTESEHLEAYFNKNDTKATLAYKLRALADKVESKING